MERLHKALAHAGVASRRSCERLIAAGRVTVNGQVVTTPGVQVTPGVDILAVDGRVVAAVSPLYIMLNKPVGYVSTTSDPQHRPTVLNLVSAPPDSRLYPVGRLDIDSEGLLLLTNDGDITQRLTHPSFRMEKEYQVWVEGRPTEPDLARLRAGLPLDGKPAPVDDVSVVEQPRAASQTTMLRVVIHEGRKREIRRLFAALGYRVQRLQRVRLGPLRLVDLPPGASRRLTDQEVAHLKRLTAPRSGVPAGERQDATYYRRLGSAHAARQASSDHNHH